jgi:hypothetical protein
MMQENRSVAIFSSPVGEKVFGFLGKSFFGGESFHSIEIVHNYEATC